MYKKLITCLVFVNLFFSIYFIYSWKNNKIQRISRNPVYHASAVFYFKGYIDHRYKIAKLRVFSMSECIKKGSFITAEISYKNSTDFKKIRLIGRPTEVKCPWKWAKNCDYNSFIFESKIKKNPEDVNKVRLILEYGKKINLEVRHVRKKPLKKGLTVCVQPVYWYSQVHNILLFFEAWKAQGATNFIVYFHSSTREVRKVLEFYENSGILKILSWPSFGNSTVDASSYRVGHTLAQNLCVLEVTTDLTTITDFDEVISANKTRLWNYIREEFSNSPQLGALKFRHHTVTFDEKIEDLKSMDSVLNPRIYVHRGPTKIIFNTSVADVVLTHKIYSFIDSSKIQKNSTGALLHYRYNIETDPDIPGETNFQLFPAGWSNSEMKLNVFKIFGENVPEYNPEINLELNTCINSLVQESKCRSTVVYCRKVLENMADWVFEKTPNVFLS